MNIEIVDGDTGEERATYPYLGLAPDSGLYVLFFDVRTGVSVGYQSRSPAQPKTYYSGHFSTTWAEDDFVKVRGSVVFRGT